MKKTLLILFLSPLIFSIEDSGSCSEIELFFIAPNDGFKSNSQKFTVKFGSNNILISPAGVVVDNVGNCEVSGHHHLIINNAYEVLNFENEPIPYAANILHFGGGQTEAELSLPPGNYSLQLVIGNYEHKPINQINSDEGYSPIVSKIINIEILP